MSRLQQIERRIDQKLREILRSSSPNQRRELVEVHRAILDEVASRVDTLPRGRLSFGYSHVKIRVLLAAPERRRSYELVFIEANALARDITGYFEEHSIEFSPRLKVEIELVDNLPPDVNDRGFDVSYSNTASSAMSLEGIQIRLTVLVGNAKQEQYCFKKERINLGRLAEVLDADMRTVRRNDVALSDETGGPNSTVSRTHAHIEFDRDASRFRLFDDGSTHGTTVVRDGSVIPVPKGASNGVPLQRGDEILLGQVHIRFEHTEE